MSARGPSPAPPPPPPGAPPPGGPPAEDELHAYVDGLLPPQRAAELEAWLAGHPAQQARVRQWQAQVEGLHRLFDPVLDEPLPPRLRPAAIRRRRRLPPAAARAAAAALLLAAGLAGGWWLHAAFGPPAQGSSGAGLADEAVNAHRVYAVERRHPVEVGAAEHAHLVGWLSRRLGAPLATPDLRAAGFALVGGRLLPAQSGPGGPAAQFMYEDAAGQRITVYVRPAGPDTPAAFRFAAQDGADAFYWTETGLAYAVVGALGRDRLSAIADEIHRQLAPAAN